MARPSPWSTPFTQALNTLVCDEALPTSTVSAAVLVTMSRIAGVTYMRRSDWSNGNESNAVLTQNLKCPEERTAKVKHRRESEISRRNEHL